MASVPESTCKSCGQRVPLDRDACPYCSTPVDCYWFDDMGATRRAVLFADGGRSYALIDGETMPLAEAPAVLRGCISRSRTTHQARKAALRFLARRAGAVTWLIIIMIYLFMRSGHR